MKGRPERLQSVVEDILPSGGLPSFDPPTDMLANMFPHQRRRVGSQQFVSRKSTFLIDELKEGHELKPRTQACQSRNPLLLLVLDGPALAQIFRHLTPPPVPGGRNARVSMSGEVFIVPRTRHRHMDRDSQGCLNLEASAYHDARKH